MKKFILLTAACILMLSAGCSKKKSSKDLYDEYKSGVAMVLNSYYYEIELPNGEKFYCSGLDEDGTLEGFTDDEEEARKNRAMMTGTAFFIDNEGTLMTNRHVVSPIVPYDDVKKASANFMKSLKRFLRAAQDEMQAQYSALQSQKSDCYRLDYWGNVSVDQQALYAIQEKQDELEESFNKAERMINEIEELDLSEIKVSSINEVGLAYDNTFVTKAEDFLDNNPCVITKVSEDEDVDLALIQLKNKTTPSDKSVLRIKGLTEEKKGFFGTIGSWFGGDDTEEIDVDMPLVMIGYNAGLAVGNTRQGVQTQMTDGKVSQKPDGKRVLYTIPALQGSSGSPVLDNNGYVRAVNYAGISSTQSFNYGIPDDKIRDFVKK